MNIRQVMTIPTGIIMTDMNTTNKTGGMSGINAKNVNTNMSAGNAKNMNESKEIMNAMSTKTANIRIPTG